MTSSYCAAEVSYGLHLARQEAERLHGKLDKPPFLVTDNGSSFLAKRFAAFVGNEYTCGFVIAELAFPPMLEMATPAR